MSRKIRELIREYKRAGCSIHEGKGKGREVIVRSSTRDTKDVLFYPGKQVTMQKAIRKPI